MLDFRIIAGCILAVALYSAAIAVVLRWRARWSVQGLIDRVRRDRERGVYVPPKLQPESQYVVSLTESEVTCRRPDGSVENVAWDDLQRVEIVTTDEGPFLMDVFWVLHGTETGCVVPQGATGEQELLQQLQRLPGFQNAAVIEAMSCSDNRHFLCWENAVASERITAP